MPCCALQCRDCQACERRAHCDQPRLSASRRIKRAHDEQDATVPPTASPNAKRARLVARPRVPALRTAHVLSATTFSSGRVMGALLWFHCVQFSSTAFSSVHPNPPCNPPVADAVTMRHRSSQGRPSFSNAFCACVCVRCFRAHHPFARLRSGTSAASSRHHATKRRGPARVRFSPTPAATKVTTVPGTLGGVHVLAQAP